MTTTESRVPRGMRDLLPPAMRRRQLVTDTLRGVFEDFGFEPLETPALELAQTLTGKYGPEAERLIYLAGLGDERDLALRYDLSVPLARVCATYDDLPRPFRRYQIAPVWRGERPQRGRYREFVQADVDIVGSTSMLADAEIIAVVITALERLGLEGTRTKINNRKLLNAVGRAAGVPEPLLAGAYRAIDKLDKLGPVGVRLELRAVGLPGELLNRQRQAVGRWLRGQADRARLERDLSGALDGTEPAAVAGRALPAFFAALASFAPGDERDLDAADEAIMAASIEALRDAYPAADLLPDAVTGRLLDLLGQGAGDRSGLTQLGRQLADAEGDAGVAELGAVLDALAAAGVPSEKLVVDVAMVRGLEYYTGTIFETVVTRPAIGSITGGGRYDRLIALFGRDLPAVGTSLGVDRLVEVMDEVGLFAVSVDAPPARVLVSRFDAGGADAAVALAARLRAAGLATELYLEADGLGDQIRYALRRGIPAVAIIGPDEIAAGTVTVRDLARGIQRTVAADEAPGAVREVAGAGPTLVGAGAAE